MDDWIQVLFWVLIFGGAALWKVLAKAFGTAETVKKVAEAGKQSKNIFEALLSGDEEKLKDLFESKAESKPPAAAVEEPKPAIPKVETLSRMGLPTPPPARTPAAARRRVSLEPTPARPQGSLAGQLRRVAAAKATRPAVRAVTEEEALGDEEETEAEGTVRRQPLAAPTVSAAPVRAAGPPPPRVAQGLSAAEPVALGARQWLTGDRRRLREAFIIREVLGPPRALSGRGPLK